MSQPTKEQTKENVKPGTGKPANVQIVPETGKTENVKKETEIVAPPVKEIVQKIVSRMRTQEEKLSEIAGIVTIPEEIKRDLDLVLSETLGNYDRSKYDGKNPLCLLNHSLTFLMGKDTTFESMQDSGKKTYSLPERLVSETPEKKESVKPESIKLSMENELCVYAWREISKKHKINHFSRLNQMSFGNLTNY